MSKWKHLTEAERKLIKSLLAKDMKLNEIADLIGKDPSSISKEIKRNRTMMVELSYGVKHPECKRIERFPYVCDGCPFRSNCINQRFTYHPIKAQENYEFRRYVTRTGINMEASDFMELDKVIKNGVDEGYSIYHIMKSNPKFNVSIQTIYRWINEGKLTTKRMDLPYAVKYKVRKVKKKYEYKENVHIDRSKRTYIDYLKYVQENALVYPVQMDFLGNIITDKKSILVMTIPRVHYVILFLIDGPNQSQINGIFNSIEAQLTTELFIKIFPAILTDRDTCFSQYQTLEVSPLTGERRTQVFYCDPLASSQKANVEQMNQQLRRFFPKKQSIDHLDNYDIKDIENRINATRVQSLSGFTPDQAFTAVFGENVLDHLKAIII